MKENLSIPMLKAWAVQHQKLALAVCMARALAECERARVNGYIVPLFNTFTFTTSPRWGDVKPITNKEQLYLSDDETQVKAFYEASDEAHREHDFTGPAGHCPALIAERDAMDAERALLDAAAPLIGAGAVQLYGKDRADALDLFLSLCLSKTVNKKGKL